MDELYEQIEGWLKDFENNDVISFEYKQLDINEEYIGIYKTKKMI